MYPFSSLSFTDAYTLSIEGTPKDCPVCRKSPHTSGCNTGISFTVKLSSSPDVMSVGFGSGVQDVLSCFGPPNTVFARPIGKLAIHEAGMTDGDVARACCTSSHSTAGSTAPPHTIEAEASGSATGYFYNYPLLGLDVLFDGSSHTVTKFILHTNFPR